MRYIILIRIIIVYNKQVLLVILFLFSVIGCQSSLVELDNLDLNQAYIKPYFEIPGLKPHQSMAFYDEKGLFIMPSNNNLICDIYDLNSKKQLSSLLLPTENYSIPHANTSCFGPVLFSENSVFPTLYVSSWNNGRQAFVYDISSNGSTYLCSLLQVIDPSKVSEEIIGGGYLDWIVDADIDTDTDYLYSLAYHIKGSSSISEGNYIHVTKFRLPSLIGNKVLLTDADVEDSFTVPVMTVFQDKCVSQGHLYVVAGAPDENNLYPPRLFDIDVKNRIVNERKLPLNGEPEGLCFYSGHKWLNMYGHNIVYNIDYLLGK